MRGEWPHVAPPETPDPSRRRYSLNEQGEVYESEYERTNELEATGGFWSQTTRATNETGSYYDVPLLFGLAVRIQNGEYTIDETARVGEWSDWDQDQNETYFSEPTWGYDLIDYWIDEEEDIYRTTTTGKYGPAGVQETKEYSDSRAERYFKIDDDYLHDGDFTEVNTLETKWIANDNGELSGHVYKRQWAEADPGILDPVTEQYVPSFDYVLINEDLFTGTPPAGPGPLGPQQAQGAGESGEEGEDEPGQPVFSPGTIDVTISPAVIDALKPQAEPLDGINRLDAIIRKAERGEELTAGEIASARALYALDAKQRGEIEGQLGVDLLTRMARAGLVDPGPGVSGDLSGALDSLQTALDYLGFSPDPVIGPTADGLNAGIHAARGNWGQAGVSLVAIIAVVGDLLKGGKLLKAAANSTDATADTVHAAKPLSGGVGKLEQHHSDPLFMGGNPKQKTTSIHPDIHRGAGDSLHNDLNDFLRGKTDAAGNHMRPQRGNSAADIFQNFGRKKQLDAMAEFYKKFRDKYPDAARDFFEQHPGLE